ncbi:cytochrome P450 [Macrolepiota fuliginosa MF-IS2]|uniref:Cytochrome P450 n=1 Tax=Macrolepiota fuliginosa MF-IS2 TaxID=1400762 RepID=A0A9P5X7Q3_9AGAR|nr:cytochrome P450 [Macrolepiota fuliginosa MF-IS2]
MSLSRIGVVEVSLSLFALALLIRFGKRRIRLPLPPGPTRKFPIVGNMLELPTTRGPQTYAEWSKIYGSDMVHLGGLGQNLIVINNYTIASDLFEKRGHIYSCRPQFTFLNEMMGMSCIFAVMPYGEEWRECRRTFVQHFPPSNRHIHQPKELQLIRTRLLPQLLQSPDKFMGHIRHVIGGILISLAYGMDTQPTEDPWIELAEEAMCASAAAAVPGKYFVDLFPSLKHVPEWFPGAGFKRQAREWRDLWTRFRVAPFLAAEENIAKGDGQQSFVSSCLDSINETCDVQRQKTMIRDTAASFFAAGADTTHTSIVNFILAMTLNPDAQAKAQAEIDSVLENGRLPEFTDEDSLPYVTAVMKEVMRWQPPNPLAVPHLVTENDTYNGYHIPKGSCVMGNAWAMSRDEERYPEPELFKPERFLTPDGKLNPNAHDPFDFVFGFGRRKCVGIHIAISTIWMAMTSILATLDISKEVDEFGNVIEPIIKFKASSIVALPLPFKCSIKPRSKEAENLIYTAAEHSS